MEPTHAACFFCKDVHELGLLLTCDNCGSHACCFACGGFWSKDGAPPSFIKQADGSFLIDPDFKKASCKICREEWMTDRKTIKYLMEMLGYGKDRFALSAKLYEYEKTRLG